VRQHKETMALFSTDEELQEFTDKWLQQGKYDKIRQWWVKGLKISWQLLYTIGAGSAHDTTIGAVEKVPCAYPTATAPRRISLPTYPFARERYWFPTSEDHRLALVSTSSDPRFLRDSAVSELAGDRFEEPRTLVAQGTGSAQGTTPTATDRTNKHGKILNKPQRVALQPLTDSTVPSDQRDRTTRANQSQSPVVLPSLSQPFSQSSTNGVVAIGTSSTPEANPMATAKKKEALPATTESVQDSTIEARTDTDRGRRDSGLPLSVSLRPLSASASPITTATLEDALARSLAKALYMDEGDIDVEKPFTEMGLDSVIGVEWIDSLNKQYAINLKATRIYDYPTIRQMAGFLQKELLQRGEEMQQTAVQPVSILSLDDILEKVEEGVLSIDAAENVLSDILQYPQAGQERT